MSSDAVVGANEGSARAGGKRPAVTMWPRLAVCFIAGVFILACCLPAVKVFESGGFAPGWVCLVFGVVCFLLWLPNPLLLGACCYLWRGQNTIAFLLGLPASFFAAFVFAFWSGTTVLSWGYYLWVADMLLLTIYAGIRSRIYEDCEAPDSEVFPSPGGSTMRPDTHDEEDIVRVASGPMVTMEMYRQALEAAGIECKVMGESLTASFGTAIPDSVELLVKSEDVEKAQAAIKRYEEEKDAVE